MLRKVCQPISENCVPYPKIKGKYFSDVMRGDILCYGDVIPWIILK